MPDLWAVFGVDRSIPEMSEMTHRKYRCPRCKQKTGVDILYGMPIYRQSNMQKEMNWSWAVAVLIWMARSAVARVAAMNGVSSAGMTAL